MITILGCTVSNGVKFVEEPVPYVAGLYKTTTVTGRVFYNPATNGF
jgi:hypothetical protein